MSNDLNILEFILDTFDPKNPPQTLRIDLENDSAEKLAPYINLDPRIKEAYLSKVDFTFIKNSLNNTTDTIETA
jgi:hypothetical protein